MLMECKFILSVNLNSCSNISKIVRKWILNNDIGVDIYKIGIKKNKDLLLKLR